MRDISRREAIALGTGAMALAIANHIGAFGRPEEASAATSLPSTAQYRTVSGRYAFDAAGIYGTYRRVTNVTGRDTPVFCLEPEKGGWDVPNWVVTQSGISNDLRTALWFGCDGPGFDASMWPNTWDGASWTYARYFLVTHVLLSELYRSRSEAWQGNEQGTGAHVGPPPTTYGPYVWYVNNIVNSDGLLSKMKAKANQIPSTFSPFFLNKVYAGSTVPPQYTWSANDAARYQTMLTFNYPSGFLRVIKEIDI